MADIDLRYTDKDFDSLLTRLRVLASSRFASWQDFDEANFENTLLELQAHVGDLLTAYLDAEGRESRISTARRRRSMLALVKLLDYRAPGARAARATLRFSLAAPHPVDVLVPIETPVRTPGALAPIRYRVLEPGIIVAGETSVDVLAEASEARDDAFESTGLPNIAITLGSTPYLENTVVVTAGNGSFVEVRDFLASRSTDTHFVLGVDAQDRATIRFGSGRAGLVPVGSILVSYRTGGGASGTVDANTLTVIESTISDVNGASVSLLVTNPEPSSPGVDRAGVDEIRDEAPRSLRTMSRSVTREDFEDAALLVPGVTRALMLTSNEDVSVAENEGELVILPLGGGIASVALRDEVLAHILTNRPPTLTFRLRVLAASLVVVDVATRVYFDRDVLAAARTQVRAAIAAALVAYFKPEPDLAAARIVDFGYRMRELDVDSIGSLPWSDVHGIIERVPGVRKLDDDEGLLLAGARQDVVIPSRGFPVLGTVTVIDGATGTVIV